MSRQRRRLLLVLLLELAGLSESCAAPPPIEVLGYESDEGPLT